MNATSVDSGWIVRRYGEQKKKASAGDLTRRK
jgi:hypothetical protein